MGDVDALMLITNPLTVTVGVAVGIVGYLSWKPTLDYIRGRRMNSQRRKEVHNLLTGAFTDKIMDLISLDQLTWEEAREEGFLPLKRAYPRCKDLYPSEDNLKERINKALVKMEKIPLPGRTLVVGKLLFTRRKP